MKLIIPLGNSGGTWPIGGKVTHVEGYPVSPFEINYYPDFSNNSSWCKQVVSSPSQEP